MFNSCETNQRPGAPVNGEAIEIQLVRILSGFQRDCILDLAALNHLPFNMFAPWSSPTAWYPQSNSQATKILVLILSCSVHCRCWRLSKGAASSTLVNPPGTFLGLATTQIPNKRGNKNCFIAKALWLLGVLTPIASSTLPVLSNCLISPQQIYDLNLSPGSLHGPHERIHKSSNLQVDVWYNNWKSET